MFPRWWIAKSNDATYFDASIDPFSSKSQTLSPNVSRSGLRGMGRPLPSGRFPRKCVLSRSPIPGGLYWTVPRRMPSANSLPR